MNKFFKLTIELDENKHPKSFKMDLLPFNPNNNNNNNNKCQQLKFKKNFKFHFFIILNDKWYYVKVLPKKFHLNGHTMGFR